ncbi:GNAT family N-acetyltransferase [Tatumella punctata]
MVFFLLLIRTAGEDRQRGMMGNVMSEIIWKDLHHSELTVATLYQLLALRNQVFIVEQCCPYQDIDGEDVQGDNRHLLGFDGDKLAACARVLVPADNRQPLSIGRVIVAPYARGRKLGHHLLEKVLESCQKYYPRRTIRLSAQAHLQSFYRAQGFAACTEVYQEDGIDHIGMLLQAGDTL